MTDSIGTFDIAIVGAGIAGVSAAAELAPYFSVAILERESQPAYHTSGRSAALFTVNNGNPLVCALSAASEPFYANPPAGFCEYPLLAPRGFLHMARADQRAQLDAFAAAMGGPHRLEEIDEAQMRQRIPLLREGYAAAALWDPTAADIDVHALLQGYLKLFRAAGGILLADCDVKGMQRSNKAWTIETRKGVVKAQTVVNAAGSWADELATLAGLEPIGLTPLRRTAMIVEAPAAASLLAPGLSDWPMTRDIDEQFYLKPESGALLLSPSDETPMPPQDIQPDELDIAICVDRIEKAFELKVQSIKRKWAGLRTFAPDRSPVVGFEPGMDNYFWLAGQGGYGYQTAPALARLSSALLRGEDIPEEIQYLGITQSRLSPARFR